MRTELALAALLSWAAPAGSFPEEDPLARKLSALEMPLPREPGLGSIPAAGEPLDVRAPGRRGARDRRHHRVSPGRGPGERHHLRAFQSGAPRRRNPLSRARSAAPRPRSGAPASGRSADASTRRRSSAGTPGRTSRSSDRSRGRRDVHARRLRGRPSRRGGRRSRGGEPSSRASRTRGVGRAQPCPGGDGEAEIGVRRRDGALPIRSELSSPRSTARFSATLMPSPSRCRTPRRAIPSPSSR